MDKYLLEILKSVNTIIIPGLGALTITNHDTGEIMFMSYLKHDDGKLTQYIVDNEGYEELEAKNIIAKYVREIQLTIDKGESYDMFQFGSFYKNGDEIDFKNWEGTTKSEDAIVAPLEETEVVIEKIDEAKIDKITPPVIEKNIVEPDKEVAPVVEDKIAEAPVEKEEPIVVHLKEEVKETKKELNILEKEERAVTAAKLEKLKTEKNKPVQKNKKGVGFWMLMSLIVLIVAGGTYFGLNYDRLKQHVPFLADNTSSEIPVEKENLEEIVDETPIEEEVETQDETISEEQVEPAEVIEKTDETQPASSGNDLPFHIIAGAFSSEASANRLGDKLRGEGYTVKIGPGRGMTLVSVKSFSTRDEAQKGLSELNSVAPNGWIYEWK